MNRLVIINRNAFCDLINKNRRFQQKINRYNKQFNIHKKASEINQQKMSEFIAKNQKQKIAYQMAQRSNYDGQLKNFIKKFNVEHKNQITMLDFSNYVNQYGNLVNTPLRKNDLEVLKEFQKRKIDKRIAELKDQKQNKDTPLLYDKFPETRTINDQVFKPRQKQKQYEELVIKEKASRPNGTFPGGSEVPKHLPYQQGPLRIKDDFMMLLLDVRSNTKITTLNRINSFKTLLFMGNGNGIISYAKGRGLTPSQSLQRAIYLCKKNLIAIPRDPRCTVPLQIRAKFQDFKIQIRPIPGFNGYGHPLISCMLTLTGMDHCAFKVTHSDHNIYNALNIIFKSVTRNTTPQQLAEREGFKVYRHQFIRPFTYEQTHSPVSTK